MNKTKRRFEYVGGTSDKFWEISISGKEVTVRFGRRGSTGQGQVKSFPDEAAAAKHVVKMIEGKVAKGYEEVA